MRNEGGRMKRGDSEPEPKGKSQEPKRKTRAELPLMPESQCVL